ncbi:hypothetical protein BJ085DRAFT_39970 [Dimargaris cristalligena]|uniref:DBF4-type domain-containing protein n=1 Tax=Dimargaris cristalligena TaxID=215637 RepID=A0A4V1J570_9FUNG|nr:hypothetical protein BJ085DRAFT_39970 [Dimargaris cristalligena]|eukprot:RKP38029.1 hypothetical protein BJ085DRAFT_39970 [Dimargaris cristalligena]
MGTHLPPTNPSLASYIPVATTPSPAIVGPMDFSVDPRRLDQALAASRPKLDHQKTLRCYQESFPRYIFYFDSIDRETLKPILRQIQALGGTTESFFSSSVTHVILPDAQASAISTSIPATPCPTSAAHTPVKPPVWSTPIDRDPAATQATPDQRRDSNRDDIIQLARSWNIKIWTLDRLVNRLLRYLPGYAVEPPRSESAPRRLVDALQEERVFGVAQSQLVPPSPGVLTRSMAASNSLTQPDSARPRPDVHYLKQIYVLVEDVTNIHRPVLVNEYSVTKDQSEAKWPKLYMVPPGRCPFVRYDDTAYHSSLARAKAKAANPPLAPKATPTQASSRVAAALAQTTTPLNSSAAQLGLSRASTAHGAGPLETPLSKKPRLTLSSAAAPAKASPYPMPHPFTPTPNKVDSFALLGQRPDLNATPLRYNSPSAAPSPRPAQRIPSMASGLNPADPTSVSHYSSLQSLTMSLDPSTLNISSKLFSLHSQTSHQGLTLNKGLFSNPNWSTLNSPGHLFGSTNGGGGGGAHASPSVSKFFPHQPLEQLSKRVIPSLRLQPSPSPASGQKRSHEGTEPLSLRTRTSAPTLPSISKAQQPPSAMSTPFKGPKTQVTNIATTLSKPTVAPTPAAKKPGFCENCRQKYDDLYDHVKSPVHQQFARNNANYLELDNLLDSIARPLQPEPSLPSSTPASTSLFSSSSLDQPGLCSDYTEPTSEYPSMRSTPENMSNLPSQKADDFLRPSLPHLIVKLKLPTNASCIGLS